MPSPRYIQAPEQSNWLGKTLESFIGDRTEKLKERQESDALQDIYKQYEQDGKNLEKTIFDIQSRPGISPTTRVNTIRQLMQFKEHNAKIQKEAKDTADKANQVRAIEKQRGLPPGSLAEFDSNPSLANTVTKPSKGYQADEPMSEDQLRRAEYTMSLDEYKNGTPSERNVLLIKNKVSPINAEKLTKPDIEEYKVNSERDKILNKKQAENDAEFVKEQSNKYPSLIARQQTLESAYKLNEEGATGKNWDLALQATGLLQYTSAGYRQFASYAKEMVKNANIKSIIGSQISAMEFGFFRDATISERFSREANSQIIKKEQLAARYEKLYYDITAKMVEENGGVPPEGIQRKVNDEFAKQSEKITKELKQVAIDYEAIQNVPEGKVLMFDKKRRPLHVPANEVEKATKSGASLS